MMTWEAIVLTFSFFMQFFSLQMYWKNLVARTNLEAVIQQYPCKSSFIPAVQCKVIQFSEKRGGGKLQACCWANKRPQLECVCACLCSQEDRWMDEFIHVMQSWIHLWEELCHNTADWRQRAHTHTHTHAIHMQTRRHTQLPHFTGLHWQRWAFISQRRWSNAQPPWEEELLPHVCHDLLASLKARESSNTPLTLFGNRCYNKNMIKDSAPLNSFRDGWDCLVYNLFFPLLFASLTRSLSFSSSNFLNKLSFPPPAPMITFFGWLIQVWLIYPQA